MNCLTAWIVPSVHELWLRHINCIFDALIAIQFMEQSENSWQLCGQIMQTKFAIHYSLFYLYSRREQAPALHISILNFSLYLYVSHFVYVVTNIFCWNTYDIAAGRHPPIISINLLLVNHRSKSFMILPTGSGAKKLMQS